MPFLAVDTGPAVPIRRAKGITITFVNQDTNNDCYFDDEPVRLNAAIPGSLTTANGTKIAKAGGQLQISEFKGIGWFRANAAMILEVQP